MKDCFITLLEEPDFLAWLPKKVDLKLIRLNNLLATNQYNKRDSHITPESYRKIYDFWLSKSITSNNSANDTENISELSYLRQFRNKVS